MDRDISRIERKGVEAATRIGFRVQAATLRAYRRGSNPIVAMKRALVEAEPLIAEAMAAGHLAGKWRSLRARELKLSIFDEALAYYAAVTNTPAHELLYFQRVYNNSAHSIVTAASSRLETRLLGAFQSILDEGLHVRDGVKRLAETFSAEGLTPTNSYMLENIFRTQTQLAYSAGQWKADQDPVAQEILWGYKYVTVGDSRVRDTHAGFDGMTLPKDDPLWRTIFPPNGWSCRCKCISIYEKRETVLPKPDASVDEGFEMNPAFLIVRSAV